MASKYLQKFPVPPQFMEILGDFTKEILRKQPSNIIQFGAKYFAMLEEGKKIQSEEGNQGGNQKEAQEKLIYEDKNEEKVGEENNENGNEQNREEILNIEVNKEFDAIDTNKNGFIESNEIVAFLKKIMGIVGEKIQIPEEAVTNFIEEVDQNMDGKISRQEFFDFAKNYI